MTHLVICRTSVGDEVKNDVGDQCGWPLTIYD